MVKYMSESIKKQNISKSLGKPGLWRKYECSMRA